MNEIDRKIYEYNNKPDAKFSGLSPYELHELIHLPFHDRGGSMIPSYIFTFS